MDGHDFFGQCLVDLVKSFTWNPDSEVYTVPP